MTQDAKLISAIARLEHVGNSGIRPEQLSDAFYDDCRIVSRYCLQAMADKRSLAALQKDAERWRKLRGATEFVSGIPCVAVVGFDGKIRELISGERLDAAIDSMEATQQ